MSTTPNKTKTKYLKFASAARTVEDVTLPSGFVFKMRPAPIQAWAATGVLPASLAAKMQAAAQAADTGAAAEEVIKTFDEDDFLKQQQLSRRLLEYCCVDPKVSVDGSDPEALAPEDITPGDFVALMKWCWSGGAAGESLSNFR